MKQTLFLTLMIVLLSSCQAPNSITISGDIQNAGDAKLFIRSNYTDYIDTVQLADGQFSAEIPTEKAQFIDVFIDRSGVSMYAKPGDDIKINFDFNALKNGDLSEINITGSPESKLLLQLRKNNSEIDIRKLLAYSPEDFDRYLQKSMDQNFTLIDSTSNADKLSKEFTEMAHMQANLNVVNKYKLYPVYHSRFAPGDTTTIPENFETTGDDIPLDNTMFFEMLPAYKQFVLSRYQTKVAESLGDYANDQESDEYLNRQIDAIKDLDAPAELKNDLGKQALSMYARMTDSQKNIAEARYTEILSNEDDLVDFKQKIEQNGALKSGKPAPGFSYPDMEGNMVSLADLKGKVVYIDVWATWCGPCKYEIPFLKKMEGELHNEGIAFVSISVDEDKSAWEQMVKDKELKGYQIYAAKAWNSKIIEDYMIKGIPRFIMIDKKGNIVDINATRPSNPMTKETLLKYAKM